VLSSEIAKLQTKIKVDHALAMELWKTGNAEARVLALQVADPEKLTRADADGLVKVDHGETNCKTPDAVPYIEKASKRKRCP
jgi:3-methyladenine DNA glycosylase AlkD